MAAQIRTYRSADRLTLQELASRSGLAASTIHKVESQQMVPTVSVLLKIAKGLGRRPEELIRDTASRADEAGEPSAPRADADAGGAAARGPAIWRLEITSDAPLAEVPLARDQRVIVWVENGSLELQTAGRTHRLGVGDCIQIEGDERLRAAPGEAGRTEVVLIATPAGDLCELLGDPRGSSIDID